MKLIALPDAMWEAADAHLEARAQYNEHMSALLTKAAHIPIHDPIVQREKHQRAIIEKALVSLASGDTQRTRELLREL